MKKFLCFLVVLCSMIVLPFSALGSTNVNHEVICAVISMIEDGISSSPNVWTNVTYDYTQNAIILDMASDGFVKTVFFNFDNGLSPTVQEAWDSLKDKMINMCNSYVSVLRKYGYNDIHIVFRLVNDDVYIRNDYSTITYNPLLVIKDGVVVADIFEDMKSN